MHTLVRVSNLSNSGQKPKSLLRLGKFFFLICIFWKITKEVAPFQYRMANNKYCHFKGEGRGLQRRNRPKQNKKQQILNFHIQKHADRSWWHHLGVKNLGEPCPFNSAACSTYNVSLWLTLSARIFLQSISIISGVYHHVFCFETPASLPQYHAMVSLGLVARNLITHELLTSHSFLEP